VDALGIVVCVVAVGAGLILPQLLLLKWFVNNLEHSPEPERTHLYNMYMLSQSTDDPFARNILIREYLDAYCSDRKEEKWQGYTG
jgi:hypothetical protein